MRPLEFYVQKVRAVPARPVLVTASIEADSFSAWWDLDVIFEQPDDSLGWGYPWVRHEDPFNGSPLLHAHEILGRRYYSLMLASPPDDVVHTDTGILHVPFGGPRAPDLDGSDRACAEDLARSLAAALDVPVRIDPKEGRYWSWQHFFERRAAEAGDVGAQISIASEYLESRQYGTPAEAAKWFRRAAEQGSADAACLLAEMYVTGRGVEENPTEALRWFRPAAEAGVARAQTNLGNAYASGVGVEADDVEAVRWYARAAEQGELTGQFNLALHYESGRGVPADLAAAARWFRSAAEQGSSWAQFRLGMAYETGRGMPTDIALAVRWYRKAAEAGHARARERLQKLDA